jgi:cell pole-organizing protein PopZ
MEEILASIRRIIADDQDASPAATAAAQAGREPAASAAAPESDDILDLAELNEPEPAAPAIPEPAPQPASDLSFRDAAPVGEPEPVAELPPMPEPVAPMPPSPVPILEDIPRPPPAPAPAPPPPMFQAPPAGETLVSTEAMATMGSAFHKLSHTVLTQNARTLEDLVTEMLRPMLKAWLEENLPTMVERLVRAEIERVARGGR